MPSPDPTRVRRSLVVLLAATLLPAQQDPAPRQSRIEQDLGIRFTVTTSRIRRAIVRTRTPYGFAVRAVADGSLARQAGITPGTIVLEVDGRPLRKVAELESVLQQARPGQQLVLKCARRKVPRSLLDRHPWQHFDVEVVLPGGRRSYSP